MKNQVSTITTRFIGAGLLAVATLASVEQKTFAADPPIDPAHAAHVAAGAMPPDATKGDPALSQQVSQLRAKVAQLEAALTRIAPQMATAPAGAAMPGMPAATAPSPAMSMGMAKMKSDGMAGMRTGAAPASGSMNMMGMMDKMVGMMDKMMSMEGEMGMDMMKMDAMRSDAAMAKTPAAGMANMSGGGGMISMMGMMDMGGGSSIPAMPQSTLPGFPGASHLYHIGATGFFLDHPEHITLTTEQQISLNKMKEQALLRKNSSDREIADSEQELWQLTGSDQPDAAKIEGKVRDIERKRADARLAFIRSVGDAANVLTDEHRKILVGQTPAHVEAGAAHQHKP